MGIYKIFLLPETINQLNNQLSGRKKDKMSNFIKVSSQGGLSKTLVNVNSLNRVSYHLSGSANKVVENYLQYGSLGLFNEDDFYSVLDVDGSNVNSLDSIEEIEDKLNKVEGIGHGMTYIPHALVKSNEDVLSSPNLLSSYLDGFTDFLDSGKVFRGLSKNVSLAWSDEMLSKVLSLYMDYMRDVPGDFSYEFAFPLGCYPTDRFETIKGKPCAGIPLEVAKRMRVGSGFGMILFNLSSFELKYPRAKRCVSPSMVSKEGKGGVVGISDYTSVLIDFQSSLKVVIEVETFIKYLVNILKQAVGVERVEEFLEDLFDMLCTVSHDKLFSYLVSSQAAEYIDVRDEHSVSLTSNNVVKGDYVYVPLPQMFGGVRW